MYRLEFSALAWCSERQKDPAAHPNQCIVLVLRGGPREGRELTAGFVYGAQNSSCRNRAAREIFCAIYIPRRESSALAWLSGRRKSHTSTGAENSRRYVYTAENTQPFLR